MSAVPRGVPISLAAFCVLYALLSFLFSLLLSFGVFLILGTAFVSLVSYFRIPQPSKNAVESVLGVDYHKLKVDEEEARALGTDPPKPSGLLMPIVAHRGACLDAPENSLSAFKLVKERGVHGVELDVSVTKDGVPIVFHDDVLDRVTQGSGKVSEMMFEEIKKLDLSSKFLFPEKFPNEKIPTLASAVDLCLELGLKIMIDIKDPHPSVAYAVLAEYRRRPELKKHALVSSFFPHMIYIVRSNDPEIVCSMALRPSFYAYRNFSMTDGPYKARYDAWWKHFGASLLDGLTDLGQFSFIPYFLGLSAILASQSVCDSSRLAHWKRQGLRVFIWTVNDPILKKYCLEYLKVPYLTDTLEV